MTALARQQQDLLAALFAWPRDNAMLNISNYVYDTQARGLKVYQNNGHALAERTLRVAYPVLAQLLGADSFAALSRALWHAHPPARGDLAQWGGDLAGFVSASDQLLEEPYLSDVARVEWALHTCAGCADRAPEPATFHLLMAHDPAALRLVLAPGCAVLHSVWPVASIVTAHRHPNSDDDANAHANAHAHADADADADAAAHGAVDSVGVAIPAHGRPPVHALSRFDAVGEKLRAGAAETAVVWRAGFQPQVREALPGEANLLAALLDNRSLDEAVHSAVRSDVQGAVQSDLQMAASLDFNAWLPMAVQTGLLLGAELIQASAAR